MQRKLGYSRTLVRYRVPTWKDACTEGLERESSREGREEREVETWQEGRKEGRRGSVGSRSVCGRQGNVVEI